MKIPALLPLIAAALCLCTAPAGATLAMWQGALNAGSSPAAILFSTVSGESPVVIDVGTLSGDRSFEFIVNGINSNNSAALLGTHTEEEGRQGLKLEQWPETGKYGITDYFVSDYSSGLDTIFGADTHIVFTSGGTDTILYVNGAEAHIFSGIPLRLTGRQGLGAAILFDSYNDNIGGNILGFASYDAALTPEEIGQRYNAFAAPVPEPSALLLTAGAAALPLLRRRRTVTA